MHRSTQGSARTHHGASLTSLHRWATICRPYGTNYFGFMTDFSNGALVETQVVFLVTL